MGNKHIIRLGIVDDDHLIVQLLTPLVQSTGQITVAYTAPSGNDFLAALDRGNLQLDIVLLDLRMKNGNGLLVMEKLKEMASDIKIIVLSSYYQSSYLGQILKAGAHAFIPKKIDKKELIACIIEVDKKGLCITAEQFETVRNQLSFRTPKLHLQQKNELSAREIEVIELLCQQKSTVEIANHLFISPKTVESHKAKLFSKTGVRNLAGIIIYAVKNKIVNPDELILIEA